MQNALFISQPTLSLEGREVSYVWRGKSSVSKKNKWVFIRAINKFQVLSWSCQKIFLPIS